MHRIFSEGKGGGQLQYRYLVPVDLIGCGRQLRIPEHIHHAVIADAVSAAVILMGIVIRHVPAKTAQNIHVLLHVVKDVGIQQGLTQSARFIIAGFCRIGNTAKGRNQVRLLHVRNDVGFPAAGSAIQTCGKIVIGIHIFYHVFFRFPVDAGRRPIRIQLACQPGDSPVEVIVFFRFAHPNAPQDDGRVVPVLKNHLLRVLQFLIFPFDIADVAGARDFTDDQ